MRSTGQILLDETKRRGQAPACLAPQEVFAFVVDEEIDFSAVERSEKISGAQGPNDSHLITD